MNKLYQYLYGAAAVFALVACNIEPASADNQCRRNTFVNPKEAADFWTPERRARAKPVDMPVLPDSALGPELEIDGSSRTPGSGVPYVADLSRAPFQSGGRLMFLDADGDESWCSAEFAGAGNILLTAAHCVRDPQSGGWNSNFLFERVYGGEDSEVFQVAEMTVRSEWHDGQNPDPVYDYAFLVAARDYGSPLELFYGDAGDDLTSFGYPINYGHGHVMYAVRGYLSTRTAGLILMQDNPMRHGSSGGAWVETDEKNGPGRRIYGLNSHAASGIQNAVWSPVLDATTEALFNYATTKPCHRI
ncbi:trypsin-like serine peptidase [Microbulbifer taiwanensis]|uniref:Trypsin-like serine peptidase n=1 Tax=Microbulbifer taiwanensis TaxID=986746 RepID=A0ABW1YHT4_9GAMM|nr:serine protease [Microbulbifer taiwanensis]